MARKRRDEERVARCRRRSFDVSFRVAVAVWEDPLERATWSSPQHRRLVTGIVKEQLAHTLKHPGTCEVCWLSEHDGHVTRLRVKLTKDEKRDA
jgi:hypothetical protein